MGTSESGITATEMLAVMCATCEMRGVHTSPTLFYLGFDGKVNGILVPVAQMPVYSQPNCFFRFIS